LATQSECIGWGFIGASTWAARHIVPAVNSIPETRPVGVFSTSLERGREFAAVNECGRSFERLENLLDDPEVDAVYISTTNDLHAEQTIAAATAGKHVLCEKPLALTLADAEQMVEACEHAGVVLATNHHLRAAPVLVTMREQIERGAIGEIVAARVFQANWLPEELQSWRLRRPDAGGVVRDITVHDVDAIRFVLGDEIDEVVAFTANQGLAEPAVEDSAMGVLRMCGGQLICFHDAFTVRHAGTGFEVHGTTGSLFARDPLGSEPTGTLELRRLDEIVEIDVGERPPLYQRSVERFCAAVRGEGPPLATGIDGAAALAVALAALESAELGRSVAIDHQGA
jgi:1,5-anhydro-D-fructose reductase (1,5-anhydro-D-mannitol-forming)